MTDFPPDAPPYAKYLLFEHGADEDEAAQRFVDEFGEEPLFVFDGKGGLKLGPIPEWLKDS